jgi:hypothetical protein
MFDALFWMEVSLHKKSTRKAYDAAWWHMTPLTYMTVFRGEDIDLAACN